MVGSLARLAAANEENKHFLDFQNPFHNNLAQAVEISLFHEEAQKIIKQLVENDLDASLAQKKNGNSGISSGVGAVEAPRGGLYHEVKFDGNGLILYANIITPTVQNLTSIEKSANALLAQHQDKSQEEKTRLLEMLVRAYDPCITCAVH